MWYFVFQGPSAFTGSFFTVLLVLTRFGQCRVPKTADANRCWCNPLHMLSPVPVQFQPAGGTIAAYYAHPFMQAGSYYLHI